MKNLLKTSILLIVLFTGAFLTSCADGTTDKITYKEDRTVGKERFDVHTFGKENLPESFNIDQKAFLNYTSYIMPEYLNKGITVKAKVSIEGDGYIIFEGNKYYHNDVFNVEQWFPEDYTHNDAWILVFYKANKPGKHRLEIDFTNSLGSTKETVYDLVFTE